MFVAKDCYDQCICARCGRATFLTKDHFIPKSCRMTVNEAGNYVGLCKSCNQEKANRVVTPDWYLFLREEQKECLKRYMRYSRSWIKNNCTDLNVITYVEKI